VLITQNVAETNSNGNGSAATICIYTKDGRDIEVTKPQCTGMQALEAIFNGKLYFYPGVSYAYI